MNELDMREVWKRTSIEHIHMYHAVYRTVILQQKPFASSLNLMGRVAGRRDQSAVRKVIEQLNLRVSSVAKQPLIYNVAPSTKWYCSLLGEEFYKFSEHIVSLTADVERQFSDVVEASSSTINVATTTFTASFVNRILSRMEKSEERKDTKVDINARECRTSDIPQILKDEPWLDFGIGETLSNYIDFHNEETGEGFESKVFRREKLYVVSSYDLNKKKLLPEDLLKLELSIVPQGTIPRFLAHLRDFYIADGEQPELIVSILKQLQYNIKATAPHIYALIDILLSSSDDFCTIMGVRAYNELKYKNEWLLKEDNINKHLYHYEIGFSENNDIVLEKKIFKKVKVKSILPENHPTELFWKTVDEYVKDGLNLEIQEIKEEIKKKTSSGKKHLAQASKSQTGVMPA